MRKLFTLLAVTVFCSGVALAIEVKTITGEGKCAKCALKESDKCQNVIEVEEGGKTVKYYLAKNKVSNDYHKSSGICTGEVKTTVTGDVEEKDGKQVITATKVEKAE
ncbi:DUF6370 family protein [Tundrisphaera lichenicola]|uniref:DUF6370 family protein n=1 Tax=Tundrisphaera lichenicola TaxID=2029860 RepID=UPI003EB71F3B